jgi:hypothetical protein
MKNKDRKDCIIFFMSGIIIYIASGIVFLFTALINIFLPAENNEFAKDGNLIEKIISFCFIYFIKKPIYYFDFLSGHNMYAYFWTWMFYLYAFLSYTLFYVILIIHFLSTIINCCCCLIFLLDCILIIKNKCFKK